MKGLLRAAQLRSMSGALRDLPREEEGLPRRTVGGWIVEPMWKRHAEMIHRCNHWLGPDSLRAE